MKKFLSLFFLMVFLPSLVLADSPRKNARQRQARQRARIHQGVKSGELTPEEAKKLNAEQREIARKKREMMKDDGHIDASERKELRTDQKEASESIREEKHDEEKKE